jgi:hypothetical protein
MNKDELKQNLIYHHQQFVEGVKSLPSREFYLSHSSKWSPAQLVNHLVKSLSPVNIAFSLPGFMLKWLFGSANRPSRSYDTLVEKYLSKLAGGGKAPPRYVPENITKDQSGSLLRIVGSLSKKVDSFTESQLDTFILPHPLLGKITLREMLYFTIYHVQHHQKQILNVRAHESV